MSIFHSIFFFSTAVAVAAPVNRRHKTPTDAGPTDTHSQRHSAASAPIRRPATKSTVQSNEQTVRPEDWKRCRRTIVAVARRLSAIAPAAVEPIFLAAVATAARQSVPAAGECATLQRIARAASHPNELRAELCVAASATACCLPAAAALRTQSGRFPAIRCQSAGRRTSCVQTVATIPGTAVVVGRTIPATATIDQNASKSDRSIALRPAATIRIKSNNSTANTNAKFVAAIASIPSFPAAATNAAGTQLCRPAANAIEQSILPRHSTGRSALQRIAGKAENHPKARAIRAAPATEAPTESASIARGIRAEAATHQGAKHCQFETEIARRQQLLSTTAEKSRRVTIRDARLRARCPELSTRASDRADNGLAHNRLAKRRPHQVEPIESEGRHFRGRAREIADKPSRKDFHALETRHRQSIEKGESEADEGVRPRRFTETIETGVGRSVGRFGRQELHDNGFGAAGWAKGAGDSYDRSEFGARRNTTVGGRIDFLANFAATIDRSIEPTECRVRAAAAAAASGRLGHFAARFKFRGDQTIGRWQFAAGEHAAREKEGDVCLFGGAGRRLVQGARCQSER